VTRENELARIVVDAAFRVHTTLGPGLLESVYRLALAYELGKRGVSVECEVPVHIEYDGCVLGEGFRADLVAEDCLVLETKSVERSAPVHKKQLLTYLRLMDKRLGLLINFGANLLKDGITRVANGMPD
jgi:GxxExxY protein